MHYYRLTRIPTWMKLIYSIGQIIRVSCAFLSKIEQDYIYFRI